jgi:hypothetical protein
MKGDAVYSFMIFLIFFIIIELIVAIINQYYVPLRKNYDELTPTQKMLSTLRFYLNVIELNILIYTLFKYGEYLNSLTILLVVSILIACIRYFLFAREYIYYFVDKTEKNNIIVDFIEGPFGKAQNIGIVVLLIYIVIKLYFFKLY